jgi:hypothetical protein
MGETKHHRTRLNYGPQRLLLNDLIPDIEQSHAEHEDNNDDYRECAAESGKTDRDALYKPEYEDTEN